MNKNEVVITSASRTAVGSLGKSLKNMPGEELCSLVISEAIRKSKCTAPLFNKGAYQYIGNINDPEDVGIELAKKLKLQGADEILSEIFEQYREN